MESPVTLPALEAAARLSPQDRYAALLRACVETPDPGMCAAAEAFGHEALAEGATLRDILAWHRESVSLVMNELTPDRAAALTIPAHEVLSAALAPFDEENRGVEALRYLNLRLEEKIKRLAHALQDDTGQLLASVYLNIAEIAADLPHRGRLRLEELRGLLDQVDDELRRTAQELRPTVLDDLGLVPACEFLAENISRRAGVRVAVHGGTDGRLAADVETALYRVVQEAVTNATRHGRPEHVSVTFERDGRWLRGSVRDDGAGFEVPAPSAWGNKGALGLMGMRQRLLALRGNLSVSSTPGSGTSIEFEVPVEY
jgi:signal transduction histidine kinase